MNKISNKQAEIAEGKLKLKKWNL